MREGDRCTNVVMKWFTEHEGINRYFIDEARSFITYKDEPVIALMKIMEKFIDDEVAKIDILGVCSCVLESAVDEVDYYLIAQRYINDVNQRMVIRDVKNGREKRQRYLGDKK